MDVIDYIASRETMLTTAEVGRLLGVGQDTLMRWANKGYITACRFRNFNLFNPAQLAAELRAAQRSSPDGSIARGMQPDQGAALEPYPTEIQQPEIRPLGEEELRELCGLVGKGGPYRLRTAYLGTTIIIPDSWISAIPQKFLAVGQSELLEAQI